MEERKLMIEISLDRYEELLDIESRVRTAGELALYGASEEVVYLVIGTNDFKAEVDKRKKEREKILANLREIKNGNTVSE